MPIIREATIALALTEPDRQWMERQLVELMRDADGSVRSIAALAVGHLARVHGQIDLEGVMPVWWDLLEDSETAGNAANALDDFSTFVLHANADNGITRVVDATDMGDEDVDLGPKHPSFAAHFRDGIYDDPADDFAPFGNDERADLLADWADRADELDSGSTLVQIEPEWFEDGPLAPANLNEDDVDMNDIVIGAGFALLQLKGQISELDRSLVLRALDIRDRTYGQQPQTQHRCAPICWRSGTPLSKLRPSGPEPCTASAASASSAERAHSEVQPVNSSASALPCADDGRFRRPYDAGDPRARVRTARRRALA